MRFLEGIKHRPWYIKLTHWEYWSFNTVYYPIILYWFYLSLKARSFFFFNAANPSIAYGGFLMESKWDIARLLPAAYTPHTSIVRKHDTNETVLALTPAFQFPIICKPDMGSRGRGVAVITNEQQLLAYHQQCPLDYLMQEKVDYPMEAGIFYVRIPGEKNGKITGIVEKEFLRVIGDGISTIRQLLMQNDRFVLQIKQLEILLDADMEKVLPKNESHVLVPFGNHARGCRFIDRSDRINDSLTSMFDAVCQAVPDFYFGRLDIRFESWDQLERGENFSIIELNGAGSEPTHMYDERHRLWDAWKEIIRHWNWLHKISIANHRLGYRYLNVKEGRKMFADSKAIDHQMHDFIFEPPKNTAVNEPIIVCG
jgi:hypothetical protein